MADRSHQQRPKHDPRTSEQQPWPDGTIARYLTVGGATVDITNSGKDDDHRHYTRCTGCHYGRNRSWVNEDIAHQNAQAHAEKCRALPRPAVTK